MGMRSRVRDLLVVAVVMLFGSSALPAWAQSAPVSLQGETFFAPYFSYTANCNPDGQSTITYTARGAAHGPYPGTFTESGTFKIGPQVTAPTSASQYGFSSGPILDFSATFSIQSPAGQVDGSKALKELGNIQSLGACAKNNDPDEAFDAICAALVPDRNDTARAQTMHTAGAVATYEARIRTSDGGVFRDSGEAGASVHQYQLECTNGETGGPGAITGSSGMFEHFVRSDGLAPVKTPGRAEGGGQIQHAPGTTATDSEVTFGLSALSDGNRTLGKCNVYDQALDQHLVCDTITRFSQIGNTASFSGRATLSGPLPGPSDDTQTRYTIVVVDGGEAGSGRDSISIETEEGFVRAGTLTQGNIQVGQSQGSGFSLPPP